MIRNLIILGLLLLAPSVADADCGTKCHTSGCMCLVGGACKAGCQHHREPPRRTSNVLPFVAGSLMCSILWVRAQRKAAEV